MNDQYSDIIHSFAGLRVLVIGEAAVDTDLTGASHRVAREAPVPIVQVHDVQHVPGRAANAALNVAELGAETTFLSVSGDDDIAEILQSSLKQHQVDADHIVKDPERTTQSIQRIFAGNQLLVRFDHGTETKLAKKSEKQFIKRLQKLFPKYDAVLVSDYGYGVLSEAVIETLAALQAQHQKKLIVDSKYLGKYKNVGVTAVKPNYQEALALVGGMQSEKNGARAAQLQAYQDELFTITGAQNIAVTLDVDGAVILKKGQEAYRTYSQPVEHTKSVGAGDTYSAALTLSLAAQSTIEKAAEIAQAAATVVVQRSGTTPCTKNELLQLLRHSPKYMTDRHELAQYVAWQRRQGKRIAFTNGCFDILHGGHVTYLNQAKARADILIVGLNTDESVRKLKGTDRPVNTVHERARVLAGLHAVDLVVPFAESTPHALIEIVQPDVYIKGGDYTRESLPETPLVEKLGGEVMTVPLAFDHSTSSIISRIRGNTNESMKGAPDAIANSQEVEPAQ